MTKKEPKYRKQLNQGQLDVLELLFKFRFGTTELIAKGLGKKNGTIIKSRLTILREQGFIDRRYDGNDRLRGKHASYYLKPEAIRALRARTNHANITDGAIKNVYKDKTVSDQFIQHCLYVFTAYCHLTALYGADLKFFTKTGLAAYDYFPRPLPDAFLSLKNNGDETKRFFLEVFESTTPAFALNRRVKQLIDYFEGGDWEATESDFPTILIICDTPILQNRVEKRVAASLQKTGIDDLVFCTTNWQALAENATAPWRLTDDPDELVTLK